MERDCTLEVEEAGREVGRGEHGKRLYVGG